MVKNNNYSLGQQRWKNWQLLHQITILLWRIILHKCQKNLSWSIVTTKVKTVLQKSINSTYLLMNSLKQSLSLWWCLVIIWLSPSSSDSWPWHKNTKAISKGPCCQKQKQRQKKKWTSLWYILGCSEKGH